MPGSLEANHGRSVRRPASSLRAVSGSCDATPLNEVAIDSTLSLPSIYTYYSRLSKCINKKGLHDMERLRVEYKVQYMWVTTNPCFETNYMLYTVEMLRRRYTIS